MTDYLTADLHFDHAPVIGYCKRPFANVEQMNAELIRNWNAVVQPGDRVYVLGDFCFGKDPGAILDQLVGQLFLVKGNHDGKKTTKHPRWQRVEGLMTHKPSGSVLCHYAMEVWNRSHHGAAHFHGHSHGSMPPRGRRADVGVDCWAYAPVSVETALSAVAMLTPWFGDYHGVPR